MMEELRERVAVVENEVRRLSEVPTRVKELEVDFSHMKSTLDDIRLQGMERDRREEMYHKDLNDQITSNHKTTLSRIGNIETKQASILTTARVAVVCLVIVWGAITAWLTIIGPALDSRIASNISNGKVTTVVSTSPASNSVVIDHGIKKTDTND